LSEDVINTINSIKKLGIKIKLNKKKCEIFGKGLFGYKYKKNIVLNAGNSGTCARLMIASIIDTKYPIKVIGDKSLSKRDMTRITIPLEKMGATFDVNNGTLPLTIKKSKKLKSIKYLENLGSAQCKSAIILAALKTQGTSKIKAKISRNHTELMLKYALKYPIKFLKGRTHDLIDIKGNKNFKAFNYTIPSDLSSGAFFIVLTLLGKNSSLILKNMNTNETRIGIIKILNKMGANIKFLNTKNINGERISDIFIKSTRNLKGINLNPKFNSSAIDEFMLIFLVASISKGVSIFKNLSELNKKESKRLDLSFEILKKIGVKVKKIKNTGIKIWGNPDLQIKKTINIKNFMKDHRIFMVSVIAALVLGGKWKIDDPSSIKTSFPNFLDLIKQLGAKISEK
jgi:3-phosphoshikimate 1-carboxyvinyltransferase